MRLCYSIVMFVALLVLLSGVSLVSACGQKGALYHPAEVQQQTDKDKTKKTTPKTKQQP